MTPAVLAGRTGTAERYVREWLNANAASNYVQYHAGPGSYSLSPEQAFALALDDTPVHLPGFFHMLAFMKDEEKLTEVFRTGKGFGWHEHEKGLFEGCERFFRPGYLANLTTAWIPNEVRGQIEVLSSQAQRQWKHARTNLWSMGVVLYEMVSGSRPFEGSTAAVVFEAILNKVPVPVRERNQEIPAELARVITRLLEKDRALQYQSAAEVRPDLEAIRSLTVNMKRSRDRKGAVGWIRYALPLLS